MESRSEESKSDMDIVLMFHPSSRRKLPGTKELGIKVKVPDKNLEQLLKPVQEQSTFDYSSFSSSSGDSSDDEKSYSKQTILSDEDENEDETHVVPENGENNKMNNKHEAIDEKWECETETGESEEENVSQADSVHFELDVLNQNLVESGAPINIQNETEKFLELCVRHELHEDGKRSNAKALRLYEKGAHDRAIHEFKWAAKHCHNTAAYYNLGVCFMKRQDFMKAIRYYEVAAERDHARASYSIAHIILNYRTKLETKYSAADGIKFLKRAAELGLKQAQSGYGIILMEKKENPELAEMAASFLKLAAKQNYPEAMYHLGICYEKGLGVEVNCAKAVDLYARASRGGYPEAQHNLGVFFERSLGGLIENKEEAMNWYKEAVKNGHHESMDDIERLKRMDATKDEVTVVAELSTFQDKPNGSIFKF